MTTAPPTRTAPRVPAIVLAAVAGLTLGALTAFGQTWLPGALHSLANSAGSWSVVAFLLALTGSRRSVSAAIGSVTLLALLAGYVLASAARGYPSSTSLLVFWGLAAVLVGPVVGLSAHEVRRGSPTAGACGAAVMSGILVGEGVYGLIYIADTTYPPYWWGSVVVGLGLLVAAARSRRWGLRPGAVAVVGTAVVAAVFVVAYSSNPLALLG